MCRYCSISNHYTLPVVDNVQSKVLACVDEVRNQSKEDAYGTRDYRNRVDPVAYSPHPHLFRLFYSSTFWIYRLEYDVACAYDRRLA